MAGRIGRLLGLVLMATGIVAGAAQADSGADVMDGDFWREHGVQDLIPLWYEHALDDEHGGPFYLNLDRQWSAQPPYEKVPAMVSRQVFAFGAAYLLSGDRRYIKVARDGVDYLMEHGWDHEYGGWYDHLNPDNTPKRATKHVQLQLYTNVGLTLYYAATGDNRALDKVNRSLQIREQHGLDKIYGGYCQALGRDLSVFDDGKNKHAHYGYVGSHTLNMYLATRDPDVLEWEKTLCDISIQRMMSPAGWIYGFGSKFTRQWEFVPKRVDGEPVVSSGAALTAALAFVRLYHQTGETRYLEAGQRLADNINTYSFDERGGFVDWMRDQEGYPPIATASVSWWIQIYGAFLQLQLYNITEDPTYLERFEKAETFFVDHFIDQEYGGIYPAVSLDGESARSFKASNWDTAYHELEHALLNYLYLNLYVQGKPAVLHFFLDGGQGDRKHYVSLVDDPRITLGGVKINGKPWSRYDAVECSVELPPGAGLRVEVVLERVPGQ